MYLHHYGTRPSRCRRTRQASIWGPQIDPDSFKFDPSLQDIPKDGTDIYEDDYKKHQVSPLAVLEWHLLYCDMRIENFEGAVRFDNVATTFRGYRVALGDERVLKNYYGFLCVRQFVHLTCLAVLRETGIMDAFLCANMRPNMEWNRVAELMASTALDKASKSTATAALWEEFCDIFTRRSYALGADYGGECASDTIRILCGDRGSFFSFCSNGHLPGCSLLLAAILRLLPRKRTEPYSSSFLGLHDLAARLYLIGSPQDRLILEQVCRSVIAMDFSWTPSISRFVNPADSRTVCQLYSSLLLEWQGQPSSVKTISAGFLSYLADFVHHVAVNNPSATCNELLDLARTSHQFMWLLLENRGYFPTVEHYHVRLYACTVFELVKTIQSRYISTQAEQRSLAKMLTNVEIINLVGRILLMMMNEGSEFADMEGSDMIIAKIYALEDAVKKSIRTAPELFFDTGVEWNKVFEYISLYVQKEAAPLREHQDKGRYLLLLADAWVKFARPLENLRESRTCAYPRCVRVHTYATLKIFYICGTCNVALYCSPICQQAHWTLETSSSHRLECDYFAGDTQPIRANIQDAEEALSRFKNGIMRSDVWELLSPRQGPQIVNST